MRVLALESSAMAASVAVLEENHLIGEYTINHKKTHSQTLLPMLDEVVKMTELDLNTVDGIAVAAGPGSFTGLRIGSATAKGLAQALNKPIIEVPTLEALAYNVFETTGLICPIMDARRQQVYTGFYHWCNHQFEVVADQMAIPMEECITRLNTLGQPVLFLGDGTDAFADMIAEKMNVSYQIVPPHLCCQRAAAVAARGLVYLKEGRTVTAADHKPDYLRLSQAERERQEKLSNGK